MAGQDAPPTKKENVVIKTSYALLFKRIGIIRSYPVERPKASMFRDSPPQNTTQLPTPDEAGDYGKTLDLLSGDFVGTRNELRYYKPKCASHKIIT